MWIFAQNFLCFLIKSRSIVFFIFFVLSLCMSRTAARKFFFFFFWRIDVSHRWGVYLGWWDGDWSLDFHGGTQVLIWQKSIGIVKAGVGGVIGVSGGREIIIIYDAPGSIPTSIGGKAAGLSSQYACMDRFVHGKHELHTRGLRLHFEWVRRRRLFSCA
ncbi:uncharacterized protein IWZ02DRAFT_246615 [Phyllosticta citriasiana]|uniref:uncharacterized protein n=1 Tax=Phyllosticta citriasiana TaxID=595635 RepID=UPI0030FDCEBE